MIQIQEADFPVPVLLTRCAIVECTNHTMSQIVRCTAAVFCLSLECSSRRSIPKGKSPAIPSALLRIFLRADEALPARVWMAILEAAIEQNSWLLAISHQLTKELHRAIPSASKLSVGNYELFQNVYSGFVSDAVKGGYSTTNGINLYKLQSQQHSPIHVCLHK